MFKSKRKSLDTTVRSVSDTRLFSSKIISKDEFNVNSLFKTTPTPTPRPEDIKYWENRSIERVKASFRRTKAYERQIQAVYYDARRNTVKEIKKIYQTYYKNNIWIDSTYLNMPISEVVKKAKYHINKMNNGGKVERLIISKRNVIIKIK